MGLHEYFTETDNNKSIIYGDLIFGQSFTVGNVGTNEAQYLTNIKVKGARFGSPGTLTMSVTAVDGFGHPTGNVLASAIVNGDTITTTTTGEEIDFVFSTPTIITAATTYAFYIEALTGDASNFLFLRYADDLKGGFTAYAGGDELYSGDGGATWSDDANDSVWFKQYGDKIVFPQETFISGYKTRYQKAQVVGYFPTSGDLRSITVNASGLLPTTVVSGSLASVPTIIKTDSVRLIPANSGGEVLHSGTTIAICVKACDTNAADIYLGGVAPYRPYSGFGFCLGGGETKCYDINDFSALYLCAVTSGDKVCFDGVY